MLNLFGKPYHHLNKILVRKQALEHNHRVLQSLHPEAQIVPVLKSNAYGHGIELVAPIFAALNPAFLVVDSLYEAYQLHKRRVKTPILILGYTRPENFAVKQVPFHIALFDLEVARSLHKHQRHCKVHIFVDTGMCREGVPLDQLASFVREVKKMPRLEIVGLASHFADADNPTDDAFTKLQLANYKQALSILRDQGIDPLYRHIAASGGAFKGTDPVFTMIRAGLASYGINPLAPSDPAYATVNLQPALQLVSTLSQIKTVKKGDRIGYNGTFTVSHDMTIGLLPLGYYEGIDRRLSNKGVVMVGDTLCPILGRVSMNMTSIDLSKVKQPKVGDRVVVYSDDLTAPNSLVNAAAMANTIPYELLVHLAASVRRESI